MSVRLTPEESVMLHALADADGVSQSDALRMLLRRAHAERFGVRKRRAAPKGAK